MIIKDIAKQGIPEIGNILPLIKNNIIPIKIDKSIEIVVVPNFGEVNSHQNNVGIILEEKKIENPIFSETAYEQSSPGPPLMS